jgi:prolyl oligopeptidase
MTKLAKSPKTKESVFKEALHGRIIHDPYRWLEADDSKEISTWIKQQNRFSEAALSHLPIRKKLAKRIAELLKVDTIGAPVPKKGFYFIMQRKKDQDLGVLYVSKGLYGKRKVLIDQNKLSKDKTTIIRRWSPSPDGKLLVYALSEQANDQSAMYVLDVLSGKKLNDYIPANHYPSDMRWNPDGSGFWYSRSSEGAPKDEVKLHKKVYYHKLGDDAEKDQLVFGNDINKDAWPIASVSMDGRWLLISVRTSTGKIRRNDLYLKDLARSESGFLPIVKDREASFHGWMHRGILYVLTNDHAPNWKLMTVPLENAMLGIKHWKTIIPEGKHVINDATTIADRLFVETLENVHSVFRMRDLSGKFISEIKLPPLGSLQGFGGEKEGDEMFLSFASFTIPFRTYRFDLKTNRLSLFEQTKVNVDVKKLATKQVWFRSKDGTNVPMFLIYQKGIKLNGKNPVLLYGYGGFSISQRPSFSSLRAAFLELGGIYALPNLRGGGEFGEKWHRAGTQKKKQNVFDDFAAAAEWLIKHNYTDHNHLAAFGWSNGGLLMGAMLTQHPELFKAVVVGAPVIDMLRFHKFHGGRHWIADYGNPDDPKAFKYLLKYSPYHNIKSGVAYPATLIVTAEGDDRVHPMHAYKFAARLQKENASSNPILLRVEGKAGHGGAASIRRTVQQHADIYGFIAWQLGMK